MPPASSDNLLSASSLAKFIASSLTPDAAPQLKSPTDAIALACHAGMLAVGFKLVGLGEDDRIEAHSESETPQPLPQQWNASPSSHAFRYKHTQSSMDYLLKVNRLGNKTVIYGLGMGHDKTATFDITTADFISQSALPCSPGGAAAGGAASSNEDAAHEIQKIFISPSRLTDLGGLLKINIIQKLMPSLQKEGYEESKQETTTCSRTETDGDATESQRPQRPQRSPPPQRSDPSLLPPPARPNPLVDPSIGPTHFAQQPRRPVPDFAPPGFEDEHEMLGVPRGGGMRTPGFLGAYGDRDLYPQGLGPQDPMRWGAIGPGLGGARGGGGGGMFPSEEDFLGGGGGAGGFDPQAPPGARFDPVGPGMPRRGGGGGGFGGGFGGGMGGPPNPFGGFGSGDFI